MTLTNFIKSISSCKKFLLTCVAILSISTSVFAAHDQAPVSDIDHTGYGNFSGNYVFSASDHVWFVFDAQAGDTIRFQLTTNFGSYAWIYRSNTGTVAVGDATTTIGGNGALTLKSQAGFFSPNSTNTVTYIVDSTGQFAIQLDHHTGSGTAGSYSVVFSSSGNVNPTPDAVATPSAQTICSGATITTIVLTGSTTGTVYNWTRDNFATVNGIAASGSGDIGGSLTNTTNAPIAVTFTITPTANGITGAPVTASVLVNTTPDVTQPANQVVCNGAPTAAVTFTGTLAGTVFNWTNSDPTIGLAASGTGDVASFTATNTGTAPVVATITVTPSSGAGNALILDGFNDQGVSSLPPVFNNIAANNFTMEAWVYPTGSVFSRIIYAQLNTSNFATMSMGEARQIYFYVIRGGTTFSVATTSVMPLNQWTHVATRWTAGTNAVEVFFNGVLQAGIAGGTSSTGTSTNLVIGSRPGGAQYFSGTLDEIRVWNTARTQVEISGAMNTSLAGNTAGIEVYYKLNEGVGITTDDASPAANNSNLLGAPLWLVPSTAPLVANTTTCTGTPKTFTITVNPTPNATVTPASQTVCSGATITPIAITGTVSGTVYNWTRDNASVTGIATTGSGDISGTLTNATAVPVTVTFTITPTYTNAGTTCTGTPIIATVVVNPTPDVTQPANQVVCNGASTAPVTFTGSLAGTVFNWTNTDPTIGLAASGTGDIPVFTAVNTGNAAVVATINVTPIAPTNAVSYTIYRTHAGNGSTTQYGNYANNAADFGNLFNVANSNTTILGTGTTTAQPIMNFTNAGQLISAGIPAPGSGEFFGINITSTFTAAETGTYTFGIDGDDGVDLSINGNVVTSFYGPHGFGGYQIGTIALVAGQTYTLRVRMQDYDGGEGLAVVWQRPSQSTMTLQGSELSISSCSGPSKTFTYTVNPTPNATATPSTQTICSGATITPIAMTGTVSGTVYNWTRDNAGVTGIAGSGTGNISGTLTNTTTAPVAVTFTITPSYTNAGVTCSGTPITATVIVNQTATVNAVANQVICNNGSTTAVTFTSPTTGGTIVYNWTNNTTSIGLAAAGTGNIASFTATNTTTAPVTATITVTPSYTNAGVTCVGTPITYTYTVNPTATVNAVANQVVCNNGSTTAVTFTGSTTGGTIVYNWTNSTTSIGLAAAGTGNIASFTATNTTTAPVTATITVTPSYTNAGVTCVGTPRTFTITVNPTATVTAGTSQVICNGSPTTAVTFNSPTTGGTIVYNWTNTSTSIGLAASGTGNIASFTATNTTIALVTATITVTPSYTNAGVTCVGTPITYTYTVNPTATVTAVTSQVICNGSPTTAVTFNSPTTGGTIVYNWTNTTTSIGLAASGTGNIASFTATNTTTAPVTATITVTPSYTNAGVTCVGTPRTFTITVNPTATVNPVANQVLCNNFPTTAVTFTSPTTGGTIVYNWTNNTTSIGLATSGTGNIANFTATNTTQVPVVATITVTPSYTNSGVTCVGTARTFTITVNPTPIVTLAPFAAICKNAAPITLTGGSPVAGPGTTGVYLVDNVAQTIFNPANYTPGLHTIVYVYTNVFGCVNSATQTILVHPIHAVVITAAPNTSISPYNPISIMATVSPVDNYTYVWRKNGTVVSGANGDRITVLANDAGTYTVSVTAPTGCEVVSSSVFTASAIVPQTLFVFPNPNTGIFNVSYNNGVQNPVAPRTILVFDSKGARVFLQSYSVNVPFGNMKVDISKFAKGLYHVVLYNSNGKKLAATTVEKL